MLDFPSNGNVGTYMYFREWIGYVVAVTLLFISAFLFINRSFNQGRPVDEVKVIAPPPMNTMEQLLAVQNAITQAEQVIQDGNIILLKLRGLLLSIFPQVLSHIQFLQINDHLAVHAEA